MAVYYVQQLHYQKCAVGIIMGLFVSVYCV